MIYEPPTATVQRKMRVEAGFSVDGYQPVTFDVHWLLAPRRPTAVGGRPYCAMELYIYLRLADFH